MKTKMKRLLSLCLALVLALGAIPVSGFAAEPAKDADQVYQIGTAQDLLGFAKAVNSGSTAIKGKLTADIDLSALSDWPGIGTGAKPFAGSLDGQNHTVTFKDADVGLFGYIMGSQSSPATVKNVITAGSIQNSGFAVSAGYAHFTMCINRATIVHSGSRVAGLVGTVSGTSNAGRLMSDVLFTY